MRPTQNMYATQEEWQVALVKWLNEEPTQVNDKQFMIFEGSEPTADNFMFEGNLLDFADCYFSANEWAEVLAFAKEYGYTIIIEDDDRWEDMGIMLDDAAQAEEEKVWYDAAGNVSPGGMYDAGGHMNAERMAEWADDVHDRKRSRDQF